MTIENMGVTSIDLIPCSIITIFNHFLPRRKSIYGTEERRFDRRGASRRSSPAGVVCSGIRRVGGTIKRF